MVVSRNENKIKQGGFMPFDPNSDPNFAIVLQTFYSQLGSTPVALGGGRGFENPGEKSHGLDTSQRESFLMRFVEFICQQTTQGGVTLTSTVIQNAVNAAKSALSGKRSY
jgi:hypothetical protein